MKTITLSEAIEKLDKKDFTIKNSAKSNANKKVSSNLPEVRKVAIAKRNAKRIMIVALFVSCFSLSVFIGYFGTFLLFK